MSDGSAPRLKPAALADFGETDAARQDALARRYGAALRGFFAKRVREAADVDDLVQEVFVRFAGRKGEAIANTEGYLFQTAANILKDRARRAAARSASAHEPYEDVAHGLVEISPERVLLGKEACAITHATLEAMPRLRRRVFLLNRIHGLTAAEIARRMRKPESTIRTNIYRALEEIEKALKASG